MGYALQIHTALHFETVECYKCGVVFAITADLNRNLHNTENEFYCPNGHNQAYVESTVARLQKELAEKERALQWEKSRAQSLSIQLGKEKVATKRLKRRVSHGVCPCCHRTVSQLAQHMKTKHPEFMKATD
jgi:hypothetical protein